MEFLGIYPCKQSDRHAYRQRFGIFYSLKWRSVRPQRFFFPIHFVRSCRGRHVASPTISEELAERSNIDTDGPQGLGCGARTSREQLSSDAKVTT